MVVFREKAMRASLETRIKGMVTAMALSLTLVLITMSLSMDFRETLAQQREIIGDLTAREGDITSTEAVKIMEKQGERWIVTCEKGPGERLLTSDGALWYLRPDRGAILQSVLHRRRHLLVAAMICLLLSAEMAVFMAYWITRPLKRLVWACSRVAKGDLSDIPREKAGSYELETLNDAFNDMVQGLKGWQAMERQISRMERLAALGEVVAGVSHEIKNPLASMRIHLDLIGPSLEGEEVESLEILSSELDRLNRVVTQLLSFARPSPPLAGPVDPTEILDWCHRMVRVKLRDQGIEWHQEIEGNTFIWADRGQLQQLLLNLILNGIEATQDGGAISLKVQKSRGGAALSVEDEGSGIPERIKDRIFDPFVTSKPEGTGLGLSVVYRIIELHRGKIDYRSSEGGTTFDLWFPDEGGDFR
nr:ATP-binding protein [uncultured Dethiosulfovibrio sp.]